MNKLIRHLCENTINETKADSDLGLTEVTQAVSNQPVSFLSKIKSLIVDTCMKYKKTSIFIVAMSVLAVYIKRKYGESISMMYNLYHQMNDMQKVNSNSKEFSLLVQYESKFSSIAPKILSFIDKQIQSLFSLTSIHQEVVSNKESRSSFETEKLWVIFKNRLFISKISLVVISRTIYFLSQTHVVLIESFKKLSNDRYKHQFYEVLVNELWGFAVKLIEHMAKSIENKLNSVCDSYSIRRKYNKTELKDLIRTLRNKSEVVIIEEKRNVQYEFMVFYLKEVENKINNYESMELSSDIVNFDEINKNTFGYISFLKRYYDICSSSLFTIMLSKQIESDYSTLLLMVDSNYENLVEDSLSMPKIISFLYHITTQIVQYENCLLKFGEAEELKAELNVYYEAITN